MINVDKYYGCFLGLAMGDAYGASFEGGFLERFVWKLVGTKDGKIRYTDDTQMSIDLISSFIKNKKINQKDLAITFAKSYHWSRGYGPGAAWLLKKIKKGADWNDLNKKKFKGGSFGNGAAMRAPVLAMCFSQNLEELKINVIKSSEITHAHPLAIEGANLIALVTYMALNSWNIEDILKELPSYCTLNEYKTKMNFCIKSIKNEKYLNKKEVKVHLGNGISAINSTLTAIYFAIKYKEQKDQLMFSEIYSLGGDTDTIGAMAGGIWGAFNGYSAMNKAKVENIENSRKLIELSEELHNIIF